MLPKLLLSSPFETHRTDNKNSISNFKPVSVLSVFSKIFEAVIKNQFALYLENIVSPFLSVYRENYSTQHVLIGLDEEWKKHLDNNEVVRVVLMDLYKAFDCVSHDLLLAKLPAYGFDKPTLKYIYSHLNPLSANPTKWPNTLKQFVGKLPTNCLSVFGYFVNLALKGLREENSV